MSLVVVLTIGQAVSSREVHWPVNGWNSKRRHSSCHNR
jgi:hypothetical protein